MGNDDLAGAVSNHVKGSISFMGNLVMVDNEANVRLEASLVYIYIHTWRCTSLYCRLGMVLGRNDTYLSRRLVRHCVGAVVHLQGHS